MPGQLTRKEKSDRVAVLSAVEREMTAAYERSFIGKEEEVLFEESRIIGGKTYMVGHTSRYVTVALETKKELRNELQTLIIKGFLADGILYGEMA